ncbi:MAG: aspartate 1-decarboxylase [Candidatus Omnitrophica bacterium]|nr:aspartate 1-decarboxylase [Candidatus Omnitrophota bacterium]MDD5592282.1 aspartate 1-decarboxylase [Candidatus Omnitrophota bacterium]
MLVEILKSKIHGAIITKKELYYQGSIGIDRAILAKSDIAANQKVQVVNFNNGSRFETYVIEEEENSGQIVLCGPAARQAEVGDRVCIIAYGIVEDSQAELIKPQVIILDDKNKIKS